MKRMRFPSPILISIMLLLATPAARAFICNDRLTIDYNGKLPDDAPYTVIFNPVSTTSLMPDELSKLGSKVLYAWVEVPEWFNIKPVEDEVNLLFDGDVPKFLNKLAGKNIIAVIHGTDRATMAANQVAAALNLRRNRIGLQNISDKNEQVVLLKAKGILVPKTLKTDSLSGAVQFQKELKKWPLIVKPIDSSGADGLNLCPNLKVLKLAFKKELGKVNDDARVNESLLVQEYLEGKEYVVNFVSLGGHHLISDVAIYDKVTVERPDGTFTRVYRSKEIVPVSLIPSSVREYALKILQSLEYNEGASHLEIILTSDGPRLVELNPRLAGGMTAQMVQDAGGESPAKILAESLVKPERFLARFAPGYVAMSPQPMLKFWLISARDGVIKENRFIEEIKKLASYQSHDILKPGQKVLFTDKLDTSPGTIILTHPNRNQIEADLKKIVEWEKLGFFKF